MVSSTTSDSEIVFEDFVELVSDSANALRYGDSLLTFLMSHHYLRIKPCSASVIFCILLAYR